MRVARASYLGGAGGYVCVGGRARRLRAWAGLRISLAGSLGWSFYEERRLDAASVIELLFLQAHLAIRLISSIVT